MYAALKGSGCDAMLRMRGRVVRETPLFVTPSAHLARLSDRLRRLKESFGQLGWPKHHSQERSRSMPHLSGARSLGHQPNVRSSFFV
jgi:hypothetical protein